MGRMGYIGGLGRATGGLALMLLAACARGPEEKPLQLEVSELVGDYVTERVAGRQEKFPSAPVMTPELKAQLTLPQLEIFMEKTNQRNYLAPEYRGGDQTPGVVEVWRTVDDISFSFRDGMLMASRGLDEVLLSADVPADGRGAAGPARGGARSLEFRAGDSPSIRLALACELTDLGAVRLTVVDQTHATRHLRERCMAAGAETGAGPDGGPVRGAGEVVNDYWIEAGTGRLLQSRQWAGPRLGYLRFRLVHLGRGSLRNTTLMRGN